MNLSFLYVVSVGVVKILVDFVGGISSELFNDFSKISSSGEVINSIEVEFSLKFDVLLGGDGSTMGSFVVMGL